MQHDVIAVIVGQLSANMTLGASPDRGRDSMEAAQLLLAASCFPIAVVEVQKSIVIDRASPF